MDIPESELWTELPQNCICCCRSLHYLSVSVLQMCTRGGTRDRLWPSNSWKTRTGESSHFFKKPLLWREFGRGGGGGGIFVCWFFTFFEELVFIELVFIDQNVEEGVHLCWIWRERFRLWLERGGLFRVCLRVVSLSSEWSISRVLVCKALQTCLCGMWVLLVAYTEMLFIAGPCDMTT